MTVLAPNFDLKPKYKINDLVEFNDLFNGTSGAGRIRAIRADVQEDNDGLFYTYYIGDDFDGSGGVDESFILGSYAKKEKS